MNQKNRLILIVALVILLVAGIAVAIVAFTSMGGTNTPEAPSADAPAEPTDHAHDPNAMAKVDTDGNVVYVYSVEELVAAVGENGNTVITLQQDITSNKAITLPYSCTVDFAGHTVATNPQQGLGIQVEAAGTENTVTTLKGGTLSSYSDSLRIKGGSIVLEDMQVQTAYGITVAIYDPASQNRIENCTLTSGGACFGFNQNDGDFKTSVTALENSTLICHKAEGSKIFTMAGGETTPGAITLGSNVSVYSYGTEACDTGVPFLGTTPVKQTGVTAGAGESSWENMTCWTTASDKEVIDILMIGNSFCHSFVEELYAMAQSMDVQLNVTNLYYAGCSIKNHWQWLQDPTSGKPCQFFITGPMGRFEHPTITTLADALEYADWDVITCQQHFSVGRTADYATALESCTPYAADMFSYLKQNYPNAKLYWQETWSYGVGYQYPTNKDDDPNNDRPEEDVPTVAVQTHQYEMIRDVSKALCAESGVDMIPTGDAWQLARARLGDTLNRSDFAHDGDAGGGQYLNACVWLEVLTGRSCVGNTWRPGDYILFEEKVEALQQSAHQAVAAIYGEDYAK